MMRPSSIASMSTMSDRGGMSYLNAKDAYDYDMELMSVFSTDQLMELAGLSVAQIAHHHYLPPSSPVVISPPQSEPPLPPSFVVVCGPGNNGGDGLVAARHLKMFGHAVSVLYPKRTNKPLYQQLVRQAEMCDIPFCESLSICMGRAGGSAASTLDFGQPQHQQPPPPPRRRVVVIVDAIFGYSFKDTTIREPFASIIAEMNQLRAQGAVETLSVDVPSGWNVDSGPLVPEQSPGGGTAAATTTAAPIIGAPLFAPNVLVSLMLPKEGVRSYLTEAAAAGVIGPRHYLGGRFVPPRYAAERALVIPTFPSDASFVDITERCLPVNSPSSLQSKVN